MKNIIQIAIHDAAALAGRTFVRCAALTLFAGALASAHVAVDLTPNATAGATGYALSGGVAAGSMFAPSPLGTPTQHSALFSSAGISDLHPASWYMSVGVSIAGNQQAGFGLPTASADASNGTHAALWTGSAASFVDLHPKQYLGSAANCTTGVEQGGFGVVNVKSSGKVKTVPPAHAMVWFGTASSAIDFNPANMAESKIYGCADNIQVGYGMPVSPGFTHAMSWAGAANTALDLNPAGFLSSLAFGVSGAQQVGSGVLVPEMGGARHALLWTGTAASAVDLNAAGYTRSIAWSTNGVMQAGEADDSSFPPVTHAVVWTGTASSMIDLNQFLPAGFSGARALGIDAAGNVIGVSSGHVILWQKIQ